MSDPTPEDPARRPMPWEPQPPDAAGAPPPPADEPPAPEPLAPEPLTPPADDSPTTQTPGLISAAPIGWAAGAGQPAGQAGAPPPPGAQTSWAPPAATTTEVPGAPGLAFADTVSRFVAYIIDAFIVGLIGALIAGVLGVGTTTVTQTGSNVSSFTSLNDAAFTVPFVLVGLVYFMFFWTGGRRATIGQRIFTMQVGNAFDGKALSPAQAFRRWLGYGSVIGLFGLIPGLVGIAALAELVWVVVLLITTATSPTKQGLHDRFANTAVVRPSGQGSSGLAVACLILVLLGLALVLLPIIALIALGTQVSTILSAVGESI